MLFYNFLTILDNLDRLGFRNNSFSSILTIMHEGMQEHYLNCIFTYSEITQIEKYLQILNETHSQQILKLFHNGNSMVIQKP
jgi:hypothetical protein